MRKEFNILKHEYSSSSEGQIYFDEGQYFIQYDIDLLPTILARNVTQLTELIFILKEIDRFLSENKEIFESKKFELSESRFLLLTKEEVRYYGFKEDYIDFEIEDSYTTLAAPSIDLKFQIIQIIEILEKFTS